MAFQSLVRSALVIGSSSVATTLVGILRVKALALMVGPAGVGLLGVLAGIAGAGTTLAALGTDTSGTRRIALEREDASSLAGVRRALLLVGLLHGIVSLAAFWMLREPIAVLILGNAAHAVDVGLVGIAVALSLLAGLQIAQLQGLGHVRQIARINILASLIGTALGLAAVWYWGIGGLIVLVLAQPAVAALLSALQLAGAPHSAGRSPTLRETLADWRRLVSQGLPYMLSFLVLAVVPLAIRAIVIRELGIEAAGHFHAAWTMSVIYIGFLLNAMSADYFPRLTALVGDRRAAGALINDQIQLGLAIGGVALIGLLAGAPLLVPLLYSSAFAPAVEIVEWQAIGNLMKIAGWPVAFLAMARGRSVQFLLVEMAWSAVLIGLVWVGLPYFGLAATGIAFAVACVAFLLLQLTVAHVTYGFTLERRALAMLVGFLSAGVLTLLAARQSPSLGALTGGALGLLLGLASLRFILSKLDADGRIAALARRAFAWAGWPMPGPLTARPG